MNKRSLPFISIFWTKNVEIIIWNKVYLDSIIFDDSGWFFHPYPLTKVHQIIEIKIRLNSGISQIGKLHPKYVGWILRFTDKSQKFWENYLNLEWRLERHISNHWKCLIKDTKLKQGLFFLFLSNQWNNKKGSDLLVVVVVIVVVVVLVIVGVGRILSRGPRHVQGYKSIYCWAIYCAINIASNNNKQ